MAKETGDELSSLAARVMARQTTVGNYGHVSGYLFNLLLRDAKRLAACVLSQDETRGKREEGESNG
jgi:hypothetical protein